MSNIYFTVTGLHHYYGDSFLEKEMIVYLKKEKDNEYDKEAISVNLAGLGKIGYVANSPYTVLGESYSAGRLYDKISEEVSIPLSEVHAICYRSPHNPLKKSIFFKS